MWSQLKVVSWTVHYESGHSTAIYGVVNRQRAPSPYYCTAKTNAAHCFREFTL